MKTICLILAVMAVTLSANAQKFFAGTGMAVATNETWIPSPPAGSAGWALSYYITPADQNGVSVIDYIAASVSDGDTTNTATIINLYRSGPPITVSAAAVAGTNYIQVNQSAELATNTYFVVRSRRYGVSQRLAVDLSTPTSITANVGLMTNLMSGDMIYPMTLAGTLPVVTDASVLTKSKVFVEYGAGTPIFSGETVNRPVLVEVLGTNAPTLHIVSGRSL